jgi:hypothetical protein
MKFAKLSYFNEFLCFIPYATRGQVFFPIAAGNSKLSCRVGLLVPGSLQMAIILSFCGRRGAAGQQKFQTGMFVKIRHKCCILTNFIIYLHLALRLALTIC